ncbi:MAG: cytochrome c oxidase assembly factor Coa1 family protein [Verrucomicrobiales bacterium]
MDSASRPGWFRRNMLWVIPSGCLLFVLLPIGGCALFIGGIFSTLKNSEPAERSLEMIARDPAVIAELGSPVEQGWMVGGNINLANADGHADLHYPVSGPSGSGSARILATRSANLWTFDEITVTIDGSGKVIDVLNSGRISRSDEAN